ncbi:hypothetical protein NDU88_002085 [Pleurodeles waltl]|uniref:Uncharacterized protein n=1 Tax=Pleurodeles waltl TaxID=8319 RepID=A0AAV7TK68_PLEWA|nr:hypothetical protein NDU88_002085 [Pleurodeles waltl]
MDGRPTSVKGREETPWEVRKNPGAGLKIDKDTMERKDTVVEKKKAAEEVGCKVKSVLLSVLGNRLHVEKLLEREDPGAGEACLRDFQTVLLWERELFIVKTVKWPVLLLGMDRGQRTGVLCEPFPYYNVELGEG